MRSRNEYELAMSRKQRVFQNGGAERLESSCWIWRIISGSRLTDFEGKYLQEYVSMSSAPVQPFVEKSPQKMNAYGRNSA